MDEKFVTKPKFQQLMDKIAHLEDFCHKCEQHIQHIPAVKQSVAQLRTEVIRIKFKETICFEMEDRVGKNEQNMENSNERILRS